MVVAKFIGIFIAFCIFVVLEAHEQNFYTARYGKRDEDDSRSEKFLLNGKKFDRSEGQEAIAERKIRFFLAGGRFGKRGCSENCFKGPKEKINENLPSRQHRSEIIRVPIRKNQKYEKSFLMGSRFGKRMESYEVTDSKVGENINCIYTGISDFYQCLTTEKLGDDDMITSNPVIDLFPKYP